MTLKRGIIYTHGKDGTIMKNKIISIMAAVCLIAGCCAYFANASSISPNEDGIYEISTYGQLCLFAELVNGTGAYSGSAEPYANAVLTADIIANDGLLNDDGSIAIPSPSVWTPIKSFSGCFDGNGYSIIGLYIDGYDTSVGMFGVLMLVGQVTDVSVSGSYIGGKTSVGMIAGASYGKISGCTVDGSVAAYGCVDGVGGIVGINYGSVDKCNNYCDLFSMSEQVDGENVDYTGGIAGMSYGSIAQCASFGSITSTNASAGGICGIGASITDCYNTGSVSGMIKVGGICAQLKGTVKNCYNTGEIFADVTQDTLAGAIVGVYCVADDDGAADEIKGSILNNYYIMTGVVDVCAYALPSGECVRLTQDTSPSSARSRRDFLNGRVAYLLGDNYGMTIGQDENPVMRNEANTVYAIGGVVCDDGGAVTGITDGCCGNGSLSIQVNDGYVFIGWYDGDTLVSEDSTLHLSEISQTAILKARLNAKGDVNGDGVFNTKDVIKYKKYLLGADDIHVGVGDVNGDQTVDTGDLDMLVDMIAS